MSAIITFEQLQTATGYDQPAAVERCLRKNGIAYLYGRNGIYTTIDALNVAMGLQSKTKKNNNEPIDIL